MTFKVLLGIGIIIIIIIIIINIILTFKVLWGIRKEFRSFFLIFEVGGGGDLLGNSNTLCPGNFREFMSDYLHYPTGSMLIQSD